jgi:hypothetical protein
VIRYVPIVDHGFAFLDTVSMRFIAIDGDAVFVSVDELHEAARAHDARCPGGVDWDVANRLIEMAEAARMPPALPQGIAFIPGAGGFAALTWGDQSIDIGDIEAVRDLGEGLIAEYERRRE